MSIFQYFNLFFIILSITYIFYKTIRRGKITSEPTNFPVIGMIPMVIQNVNRAHDYITEVLTQCGGTYELKGPWFCNLNMLFTCDPANIHHVFSRNFSNYPKGPEFRKIFDILGDGIFNADFELWEFHRNTTRSLLAHGEFNNFLEETVWGKIEHGLIPVLDHFSKTNGGEVIDLQEVFQRFTFDTICQLVLDYDPRSLSIDMPYIPCEKAFSDVAPSLLYRHVIPETLWKLMNRFKIGTEKTVVEAWKAFDEFIYPKVKDQEEAETADFNLLNTFKKSYNKVEKLNSSRDIKDFLRDTSVNLMFAGRDTTSTCLTWLFWLIGNNPESKIKILEEIKVQLNVRDGEKWRRFDAKETNKLTYLHGALRESLRLFPPVALEHKSPIKSDTLPSGHHLPANSKLIFSFYSLGRMESVWGKDCLEFKPERWISPKGGIVHEPSYKFPAFNVGPRTCLGKEMAFIQMKMVAATILYHYEIEVLEGQIVCPSDSVILQAKHGLKVRLCKRNS